MSGKRLKKKKSFERRVRLLHASLTRKNELERALVTAKFRYRVHRITSTPLLVIMFIVLCLFAYATNAISGIISVPFGALFYIVLGGAIRDEKIEFEESDPEAYSIAIFGMKQCELFGAMYVIVACSLMTVI